MKLALFDLDHTLLPLDSDHAWGEFTTRIGWTDGAEFQRRNDEFFAQYQAGKLNTFDYVRFATEAIKRQSPEDAARAHERFMQEVIHPAITPQALSLVRERQQDSDAVLIVTATNEFVTRPIAHAFGVEELIATNLARGAEGWITGEIDGTPSFQAGKVTRVEQWLAERGLGWSDVEVSFYSDSINDLPLLEKAQHPVATNPSPALEKIALERGWRILKLFSEEQ